MFEPFYFVGEKRPKKQKNMFFQTLFLFLTIFQLVYPFQAPVNHIYCRQDSLELSMGNIFTGSATTSGGRGLKLTRNQQIPCKLWSIAGDKGVFIQKKQSIGLRRTILGMFSLRQAFVKVALALSIFLGSLSTFAPPSFARGAHATVSYDASAPAMQMPGAKRYLKKHMWKPDKFDMFESVYLKADQPASPSGGVSGSSLMTSQAVTDALPIVAVGGLVLGGGYGAVKLDGYMKGIKEKWREEEIELYGEELTVDATPVEVEDVDLPEDDDDDATNADQE